MEDSRIEAYCRAICIADGVDPDKEGCGLGVTMPKGEVYPLWKARTKQALAVMGLADVEIEEARGDRERDALDPYDDT